MNLKQIISKKTSKPCRTCLVRPTCNKACDELLETYLKRGGLLRIFSGTLPVTIAVGGATTGVSLMLASQLYEKFHPSLIILSVSLVFALIGVVTQNFVMIKRHETIDILEIIHKSKFKGLK